MKQRPRVTKVKQQAINSFRISQRPTKSATKSATNEVSDKWSQRQTTSATNNVSDKQHQRQKTSATKSATINVSNKHQWQSKSATMTFDKIFCSQGNVRLVTHILHTVAQPNLSMFTSIPLFSLAINFYPCKTNLWTTNKYTFSKKYSLPQ